MNKIFTRAKEHEPLIVNPEVLHTDYVPDALPHRDEYIKQVAQVWSVALRGDRPTNLIISGRAGTGKTTVVRYVSKHLEEHIKTSNIPLRVYYVNTHTCGTVYRTAKRICAVSGITMRLGLSNSEVFALFLKKIAKDNCLVLLILDEIGAVAKAQTTHSRTSFDLLYALFRINQFLSEMGSSTRVSICGVANDLRFKQYLDARVRSTLSHEEILFTPYSAMELQDILKARMKLALRNGGKNCFSNGVLNLIASRAAKTGDARYALELFHTSLQIADRAQNSTVTLAHVEEAEKMLEEGKIAYDPEGWLKWLK